MKTVFTLLILLHALIHLLGFVKAFQFAELKDFPLQISKPVGLFWLGSAMVLLTTGFFYFKENPYWWLFAFVGLILSQVLIISQWSAAKFGTLPNLIILVVAIISYAQFNFEKKIAEEIRETLPSSDPLLPLTESSIQHLPISVRRWLQYSGVIGRPAIQSVYMQQSYQLKLKPEQKNWYTANATQLSVTNPPSFVWSVDVQMMPLLYAFGRDKFVEGKGEMLIKLLSLLPVAKDGYNPQFNEAALQRFLGELVWYPSAAVLDYIEWEEIDNNKAEATMTIGQTKGKGVFEFDDEGKLLQFTANRYMSSGADAIKKDWVVRTLSYKEFNGVQLPNKCNATWVLESGDWTWALFEVDSVVFNIH
ncbi:DUF6544 family protein [Cecembia sp.]|uniref:DUF6544 family protein n=1 Tax=Cecembia sp. TaxID=1898110 RepID=UPI0025C3BE35|nr:DUF6544 family protein [Cecembia sp.]